MLALEENQVLRDHQDVLQKKILNIPTIHIKEIGQLSKRAISSLTRTKLTCRIKPKHSTSAWTTWAARYNNVHAESQRRVPLQ